MIYFILQEWLDLPGNVSCDQEIAFLSLQSSPDSAGSKQFEMVVATLQEGDSVFQGRNETRIGRAFT